MPSFLSYAGRTSLSFRWNNFNFRQAVRGVISAPSSQLADEIGCSPDLDLEAAYPGLNLKPIQDHVGGVRVRQHANPLTSTLNKPAAVPDWFQVFADPTLPLHLDVGCGSGRFLLVLAKENRGEKNYLGLELREKLVERAESWRKELNLNNLHFLFANANASLPGLLDSYPGEVIFATILCPDPHFKNRHKKRRVVQPLFVHAIARLLSPGGMLLVASDVKDVAEDMRSQIDFSTELFARVSNILNEDGWLEKSPFTVPTEREYSVLKKGNPMFRVLYVRK